MGNSSSSSGRHQEDTVDFGSLVPQGVYTGPRDWNQPIVSQLIVARRLAPFYRPLEEYEETWDDDQILAARKELPDSSENPDSSARIDAAASVHSNGSRSSQNKRQGAAKEPLRPEAAVYRGAVECPICFLYYPRNINHSRCCDQAICTECFVQIKRAEPTTTHLVSEPAACPYCVQDNFGIVYTPPPWRAGIGSEGASSLWPAESPRSQPTEQPTHKRRQKSFGADSPEVVTTDQIRPDWEAKLAAVRAAVTRRANRRIIMRQVGDRLIPVGVGRIQTPEEAAAEAASGGSRRRRHHQNQNGNYEQYVGVGGQDLEELMLMEAMRLSLIDHEDHQKKEAEEKKKQEEAARAAVGIPQASSEEATTTGGPGPSTLEARHQAASPSLLSSSPSSGNPSSSRPSTESQQSWDNNLRPASKNSLSISRSRTPPPPAGDSSTSWHNRTAAPFSTLNAALLSSGTASAFLSSSGSASRVPHPSDTNVSSTLQSQRSNIDTSIPTITLDGGNSDTSNADKSSNHLSSPAPQRLASSQGTTSPSSSIFLPDPSLAGFVTYGRLASTSPESGEEEPLLVGIANSSDKSDITGVTGSLSRAAINSENQEASEQIN